MKKIEAVIPRKELTAVDEGLKKSGITGITVFVSEGHGKEPIQPMFAGSTGFGMFFPEFNHSNTIMILARDQDVKNVIEAIQKTAKVGKIIISDIETVIDIKTKKEGEQGL
jgi:nitrogen regulatory protein PII